MDDVRLSLKLRFLLLLVASVIASTVIDWVILGKCSPAVSTVALARTLGGAGGIFLFSTLITIWIRKAPAFPILALAVIALSSYFIVIGRETSIAASQQRACLSQQA